MIPIVDGHLDLAKNAMIGREQTRSVGEIRRAEHELDRVDRGTATTSLPELAQGGVRLVIATLFARSRADATPATCRLRSDADYPSQAAAHGAARGQLAYYEALERLGHLRLLREEESLTRHWADPGEQLGAVILMEGADPIVAPEEARMWFELGVRMVSLTHNGASAYAVGTGEEGPLTPAGRELLDVLAELSMILDLSHLSETSFAEVCERFSGPVAASHSACQARCPGARQISDRQIRAIAERNGVIGLPLHNGMLVAEWETGVSSRREVHLTTFAEHADHICQLTGSADHVAIGSDLDGGFGAECLPAEFETAADLPRIAEALADRGFRDREIHAILAENWVRFLRANLPQPASPGKKAP